MNKEMFQLYVLNDDYNVFNHVVKALVQICKIDINVAYTMTLKIHHENRCLVSESDNYNIICDMYYSLNEYGINSEILKK